VNHQVQKLGDLRLELMRLCAVCVAVHVLPIRFIIGSVYLNTARQRCACKAKMA
jgi:hypothetical protein